MDALTQQLNAIAADADQKAKYEQYRKLMEQVLATRNVEMACAFIDHSTRQCVPCCIRALSVALFGSLPRRHVPSRPCFAVLGVEQLVVSRQVMQAFAVDVSKMPPDAHKAVAA
jgi:hypothetical protein